MKSKAVSKMSGLGKIQTCDAVPKKKGVEGPTSSRVSLEDVAPYLLSLSRVKITWKAATLQEEYLNDAALL